MSKPQSGASTEAGPEASTAQLRAEFWALPPEAYVERRMAAAAFFESVSTWEVRAIKGGGPRYARIGRKVLHTKRDILEWATTTGRLVENTAQLAETAPKVATVTALPPASKRRAPAQVGA